MESVGLLREKEICGVKKFVKRGRFYIGNKKVGKR